MQVGTAEVCRFCWADKRSIGLTMNDCEDHAILPVGAVNRRALDIRRRRGRDLNPRNPFEFTRVPGVRLKPGSATSPRRLHSMPSERRMLPQPINASLRLILRSITPKLSRHDGSLWGEFSDASHADLRLFRNQISD